MPLHPKLGMIYHQVVLSNHLEKIAQTYQNDPEVSTAAMQVKLAVDAEAFGILKEAGGWLPALRTAGKAALTSAGVMLPVVGAGSYLLHRAGERAKEISEDARNKILQAILGASVIGGGLYGLHKLLGSRESSKPATSSKKKTQREDQLRDYELDEFSESMPAPKNAEARGTLKEAAGLAPALRTTGKALLTTAGVLLPVVGAGGYLLHRTKMKADEIARDTRNKILQAALGAGAVGGGLYGLHKLLESREPSKTASVSKIAEDETHVLDDAMAKLATVAAIECLLDNIPETVPENTQKLAAELRALNRGYGMRILYSLVCE